MRAFALVEDALNGGDLRGERNNGWDDLWRSKFRMFRTCWNGNGRACGMVK